METLMTVLKMFWPIYKLEKTVIQRKGASQNKTERCSQGRSVRNI